MPNADRRTLATTIALTLQLGWVSIWTLMGTRALLGEANVHFLGNDLNTIAATTPAWYIASQYVAVGCILATLLLHARSLNSALALAASTVLLFLIRLVFIPGTATDAIPLWFHIVPIALGCGIVVLLVQRLTERRPLD
ncbi:hypothetical protein [Maricaulis parjimensis]|uniref:hypothetical protein n=1 Tax=Maricaulis parjimensis TaxID=144023 RepID=UPI00193ADA4C|nr:hypothetical protein [Maricaulis parjimensis]